ncbi:rhamnogalacturonate lyase C [Fusarium napiforme]|uniref:Rhamnogalacturonate lyase C n=1 Tax=Fusarium napiforme TaxID=42672 RepID=A0A8H5IXI6_9HYPO|nr:rhamnogalacturonate lyase C [Fusarium napiforme]
MTTEDLYGMESGAMKKKKRRHRRPKPNPRLPTDFLALLCWDSWLPWPIDPKKTHVDKTSRKHKRSRKRTSHSGTSHRVQYWVQEVSSQVTPSEPPIPSTVPSLAPSTPPSHPVSSSPGPQQGAKAEEAEEAASNNGKNMVRGAPQSCNTNFSEKGGPKNNSVPVPLTLVEHNGLQIKWWSQTMGLAPDKKKWDLEVSSDAQHDMEVTRYLFVFVLHPSLTNNMLFGTQRTGLDVLLDRPRPNKWQQFWSKPYIFLAHFFYSLRQITHEPPANPISIVCISDTHNSQPRLPFGDVLIHAGDLTQSGSLGELKATIAWLNSQPHTHKIIVVGNHDILLDKGCGRRQESTAERQGLDWGGSMAET